MPCGLLGGWGYGGSSEKNSAIAGLSPFACGEGSRPQGDCYRERRLTADLRGAGRLPPQADSEARRHYKELAEGVSVPL